MVVCGRQRAGALLAPVPRRQEDLRLRREEHRLGRLHRVLRARDQEVLVQREPRDAAQVPVAIEEITHNPYTNSSSGRILHVEIPVLPLGGPARTVAAHRGPADSRSPPPRHSLMLNAGIYTK